MDNLVVTEAGGKYRNSYMLSSVPRGPDLGMGLQQQLDVIEDTVLIRVGIFDRLPIFTSAWRALVTPAQRETNNNLFRYLYLRAVMSADCHD